MCVIALLTFCSQTEYREKVLELETENKELKEKINEAQNKKENLEKQFSGVEVVNVSKAFY